MAKRSGKRGVKTTIVVPKWQRDANRLKRRATELAEFWFALFGFITALVLLVRWMMGGG